MPHPMHEAAATLPEWLTANGGIGAFLATGVLAYFAKGQIDASREDATDQATKLQAQVDAAVTQGKEIRDAARAQLQPMVFAHADEVKTWPDPADEVTLGPQENEYSLTRGQIGFGYRLKNEGTGVALNIEHGVYIDGHEIPFEGGMRFRALRPGEAQPAFDYVDAQGHFIRITPWVAVADERELPKEWTSRVYCARFDNVFGERWETRNPSDPTEAAEFRRLDEAA